MASVGKRWRRLFSPKQGFAHLSAGEGNAARQKHYLDGMRKGHAHCFCPKADRRPKRSVLSPCPLTVASIQLSSSYPLRIWFTQPCHLFASLLSRTRITLIGRSSERKARPRSALSSRLDWQPAMSVVISGRSYLHFHLHFRFHVHSNLLASRTRLPTGPLASSWAHEIDK